jgi:hypothetical protein
MSRINRTWVFTDTNQACFAKMASLGVQEELIYFICQNILGRGKKILLLRKENCFLLKGAFKWVTPDLSR